MTVPKSTIEVFRVPLSKSQLRAIPVDDRNLLLLASHAINQMLVLRRLLRFSLHFESKHDIENTLSAAQSQTILRFLFGSLAETWEMIRRPVNQRVIGRDYAGAIEPDGLDFHEKLKKHFGESNLLHTLRNTVGYHHPEGDELVAAFEDAPENEDWAWYAAAQLDNSFYLASDYVIYARILTLTGEADMRTAFEKVLGIVVPVSNDLVDFLGYVMRAIVTRHLDPNLLSPRPGTGIRVENVPNLYEVTIPFFTYRDD